MNKWEIEELLFSEQTKDNVLQRWKKETKGDFDLENKKIRKIQLKGGKNENF